MFAASSPYFGPLSAQFERDMRDGQIVGVSMQAARLEDTRAAGDDLAELFHAIPLSVRLGWEHIHPKLDIPYGWYLEVPEDRPASDEIYDVLEALRERGVKITLRCEDKPIWSLSGRARKVFSGLKLPAKLAANCDPDDIFRDPIARRLAVAKGEHMRLVALGREPRLATKLARLGFIAAEALPNEAKSRASSELPLRKVHNLLPTGSGVSV